VGSYPGPAAEDHKHGRLCPFAALGRASGLAGLSRTTSAAFKTSTFSRNGALQGLGSVDV